MNYPTSVSPSLTWHAAAGFEFENNSLGGELAGGWIASSPYTYWLQSRGNSNLANPLSLNPLGGNVGVGTATPGALFDVNGNILIEGTNYLTFNQATSGSSTTAYISWNGSGLQLQAIHNGVAYLPIIMDPNGGNVGIGTSNPGNKLEVAGGLTLLATGGVDGAQAGLHLYYDGTTSFIYSLFNGVAWHNLNIEGLTVTTTNASDARMKTKIHDLPPALGLDGIAKLRPITYHWLDRDMDKQNGEQVGLIAQEVEPVFPNLVTTSEMSGTITLPDGSQKHIDHSKALNYNGFIVPLIEAVKELKSLFDTDHDVMAKDHDAIAKLKADNDNLRAQNDKEAAEIKALRTDVEQLKVTRH